MYKRIMVAVDGSSTSERALEEAINLAKYTNGELRIVHVANSAAYLEGSSVGFNVEATNDMTRQSRDLLGMAYETAMSAGVTADVKLIESETSRIAQVVAEQADAWAADLIVAGTHGRRGASRVVLGSVAEAISRVANKPLLLVRAR